MKAYLHRSPCCQQRLVCKKSSCPISARLFIICMSVCRPLGPSPAARCFSSMRRRLAVHASVNTNGNSVRMRTLDLPGAPGPVRLPDRDSNGTGAEWGRQPQAQGSKVGLKARPAPGSPSQQHVQRQQQDLLDERRSSNGAASTREPAAGRAAPAHRSTGNGAGNGAAPRPRQAPAATSGMGAAAQQAVSTDMTTGANMGPTVPASSSMARAAAARRASPGQATDVVLPSAAASTAAHSGNRAPGMLASDFDGEPSLLQGLLQCAAITITHNTWCPEGCHRALSDMATCAAAPVEIRFDDNYRWSRESYNKTRRSFDIWSFILALRCPPEHLKINAARRSCHTPSPCSSFCVYDLTVSCRFKLWQLDQKWTYAGGMTPVKKAEKQRSTAIWCRSGPAALLDPSHTCSWAAGCQGFERTLPQCLAATLPVVLQGTAAGAWAHVYQGQLGRDPPLAWRTPAARPARPDTAVLHVAMPCPACVCRLWQCCCAASAFSGCRLGSCSPAGQTSSQPLSQRSSQSCKTACQPSTPRRRSQLWRQSLGRPCRSCTGALRSCRWPLPAWAR